MSRCTVCFRHCDIPEGGTGFCGGRSCQDGKIYASNYGRITSLALDPIEKKPLNRFHPGSKIISAGSFGCNLRCPFCQNSEISWSDRISSWPDEAEYISPEELTDIAVRYRDKGNIGIAFTYNEPLIGYEYVRDTAKLVHKEGMYNVLVTNGTAELSVLEELSPYIDAMNIDLKGYDPQYYDNTLGGCRDMVFAFIKEAAKVCHVELTTLIVTGENDSEYEIRQISEWIADLDANIPLHISRFFPCFHMTDRTPTDIGTVYRLTDIAKEKLRYVYPGNV